MKVRAQEMRDLIPSIRKYEDNAIEVRSAVGMSPDTPHKLLLSRLKRLASLPGASCIGEPCGGAPAARIPKTPPDDLLRSIAVRWDHALAGGPEVYDNMLGRKSGDWEVVMRGYVGMARQAYEEITGNGFYKWEKEL
jgi:hypothetical protein